MNDEYGTALSAQDVNPTLAKYKINDNGLRLSHFFAQVFEETGGLHVQRESLNYSPSRLMVVWPRRFPSMEIASQYAHNEEKLGNFVYGGRLGNVNAGDGFLYRGRGLLQITGRAAYAKYGAQLGIPLEDDPDMAFGRDHCLEIAAAEWAASGYHNRSCNALADADDIVGVTFAINGGQTGIDDRRFWLKKTKPVWSQATSSPADTVTSRATANMDAPLTASVEMPVAIVSDADAASPSGFGLLAANIAIGEWHKFGEQTYDITGHAVRVGHKEGETPYYRYVGDYWRIGVNNDTLTGLDHSVPWSAAFISWVMRTAGAGDRFNYSPQHSVYIFRAIKDLLLGKSAAGYYCYQLRECKPQVGDLVCWARQAGIDYEHQNGGDYAGHCDLVVEVGANQIQVVGGNVGDSVTKRPLNLNASGFVQTVSQGGENLFGIMHCRL
jgi:predicted chitinase